MKGLRFIAEQQHPTRNVQRDVGDERIAGILQRIVAVGDPVNTGVRPVLPRDRRPAPYPAAFEPVQQAAGCADEVFAAATANSLYRNGQGVVRPRYGRVIPGANAEFGGTRVGAPQCVE